MKNLITKKYTIASLTAILGILFLAGAAIAPPTASANTDASVTINTFVDITLNTCPGAGTFDFSSQDPGAIDVPINCQVADSTTTGAVRVTVEATTNTPVTISLSGTDYTGAGTIAVTQTTYDDEGCLETGQTCSIDANCLCSGVCSAGTCDEDGLAQSTLSTTPTAYFTGVGGTGSGAVSVDTWYFLDVPNTFLTAGVYTSTYTFSAAAT